MRNILSVAAALSLMSASAGTCVWTGGSGNWDTATNW